MATITKDGVTYSFNDELIENTDKLVKDFFITNCDIWEKDNDFLSTFSLLFSMSALSQQALDDLCATRWDGLKKIIDAKEVK